MRYLGRFDEAIASIALVLMAVIPLIEILVRPFMGKGIENAPLFVQHMGLVLAMWGAIAAERHGHLTSLGRLFNQGEQFAHIAASVICGVLTWASWQFVWSEIATPQRIGLWHSSLVVASHHAFRICHIGCQISCKRTR